MAGAGFLLWVAESLLRLWKRLRGRIVRFQRGRCLFRCAAGPGRPGWAARKRGPSVREWCPVTGRRARWPAAFARLVHPEAARPAEPFAGLPCGPLPAGATPARKLAALDCARRVGGGLLRQPRVGSVPRHDVSFALPGAPPVRVRIPRDAPDRASARLSAPARATRARGSSVRKLA